MIFYAMGRIKVVAAAGVYRDTEKTHIAKASWLTKAYQATRYEHATREEQISGECLESTGTGTASMNNADYGPGGSSFMPQLKNWSLRPPAGDAIMAVNLNQSRKTTS